MSHSPEDHTLRNPPPSGRPVDLERSATAILDGEGFCPQCGVVSVDEDGCCEECGADATGIRLDQLATGIKALLEECEGKGRLITAQKGLHESLRARVTDLEAAGTELLDAYQAGPDPSFAADRLARAVDAFAALFNR